MRHLKAACTQTETAETPTLRVATPVRNAEGEPFGILEIDVDFSQVLEAFRPLVNEDESLYLANSRGELLLVQGNETEAEANLHQAIVVARHQEAKLWELRATVSLCRLWHRKGKKAEARQMLAEIYDWFTEGFDTPDLIEARTLREELSV